MPRRALIFKVPKGKEVHYSKIHGPVLGKVWAPFYHGYGYYMPYHTSQDPFAENTELIDNSNTSLVYHIGVVLASLVFGWKPLIRAAVGSVLWAESESLFATWDGHVTFGSSHVGAHAGAFFLWSAIREIRKWKWSYFRLVVLLIGSGIIAPELYEFIQVWARDGFGPVGEYHIHRVDHVAHIGGILTGMLNAYLQLG